LRSAQHRRDLLGRPVHLVEVVPEHLHRDVAAHAGDQLVEAHLDGLGDLVGISRNLREITLDPADQLLLGKLRIRPILARLQDDEHVGRVRRHRVGRQLGGARLGIDELHLRLLRHHPLDRHLHRLALLDRRCRNAERLDQQIAFVELRQEHRAERSESKRRHHKASHTRTDRQRRALHGPVETGFVALLQPRDDAAVLLLDLLRQPDRNHRRHEGEREDEGEGERDDDGQRHRSERFTLHAGQREQRYVDEDDDCLPVNRGADHLASGGCHGRKPFLDGQQATFMMLLFGKPPQRVFNDDDGAVDDQTEVQSPKAHQIGRDPSAQHTKACQHHGDRDDQRRDQGRTEVAEQQEEHDDDQHRAFGQVFRDRLDRRIDQLGAVQHRLNYDVRRQRSVDRLQFLSDRGRHDAAVLADPHDRRADDDFGTVLRCRTHADRLTRLHSRNLFDRDRHAVTCRDHGPGQLAGIANERIRANSQTFAIAIDEATADAGVIALQRISQVRQRDAERGQLLHVGHDEELLGVTANRVDTGEARCGLQKRRHDPVLRGAQVGRLVLFGRQSLALWRDVAAIGLLARFTGLVLVVLAMIETNGVHVHLAQACRDRTHFRVHAVGQILLHAPQTLAHLLAGEIDVRRVRKDRRDLREAVAAQRARIFQAGGAGERGFDWKRHLLLDQLGREGRRADVDLDLIVGDVRHRVDR